MKRLAQASANPLPRTIGGWALLLPGVVAFQPTFGGLIGYIPALVGISLGTLIGFAAVRWRWGIGSWFLGLLGTYLVLGSALVMPNYALFGVIPTPRTIGRLFLLIFQGWYDLLTVATPAGDFSGPGAVPLLAGLAAGGIMALVVGRTSRVLAPLAVPLSWLGLAIAFGTRVAPTSAWLGVALGAGMLAWTSAHQISATRLTNAQVLVNASRSRTRQAARVGSALLAIAVAGAAGIAVNAAAGERVNRQVLRDNVEPPLNLAEFTSPLMGYRLYETDLEKEVLFTVTGMPEGARLRLATMDTYDGNVFNVSQNSSHYLRTGRVLPVSPYPSESEVTITAHDAYEGVWVPTPGTPSRIEFSGPDKSSQKEGLYYNKPEKQALTTAGLSEGTEVTQTAAAIIPLTPEEREKLGALGAGKASLAKTSRVPDVLVKLATDWTAEAESALDQLTTIESRMREDGFYSDGKDGRSRSGHTTERLETMFTGPQLIGDDEQYATAMALMASQLGIPVRVVMGFHPDPKDPPVTGEWEVKGTQAHVWVEANLDQAGWVVFDPTPDRNKKPKTDSPLPKPKPKPQIDPPPNPPERIPEDPVIAEEDAVERNEDDKFRLQIPGWLLAVGAVLAGGLLVASPFIGVVAWKARRTTRRRTTGTTADQMVGAWDDAIDRARDLGFVDARSRTRQESALIMTETWPSADGRDLAGVIDANVFGPGTPPDAAAEYAWTEAEDLKRSLLEQKNRFAQLVALVSLKSLRKARIEPQIETVRRGRLAIRKDTSNG